jgi:hypothetical protein
MNDNRFVYHVEYEAQESPAPYCDCQAHHFNPNNEIRHVPDNVRTRDEAIQFLEDEVLKLFPGATVTIYARFEKWVPTTHKRSGSASLDPFML